MVLLYNLSVGGLFSQIQPNWPDELFETPLEIFFFKYEKYKYDHKILVHMFIVEVLRNTIGIQYNKEYLR